MNIALLGAPGSGKGTQAEYLAEEFGLFYLQTGKIARELAKKDSRIAEIVNSGELIPEKEMTGHVLNFVRENKPDMQNILFEGFPRFINQFEELENLLSVKGAKIDVVISLDISKEKAVGRLSTRRICSVCGEVYNLITNPPPSTKTCKCGGKLVQRRDDTREVIETRFEAYYKNTEKLINYLAEKGRLVRINGEQSIKEVQKSIKEALEKLQ